MMAHAMEDASKKFIHELKVLKASNNYNITGMSAADVIAIFKSIVNNREGSYKYVKGNIFTLKIERQDAISFKLEANPKNQPGNGKITRNGNAATYENLAKELSKLYHNDTETFAKDVKRVFKDNSKLLEGGNEILQDVYILLLFEIGRRLVDDENVSELGPDKQAYDSLPISEAITIIVKLLEMKRCSFNDFFDPKGEFHCFSGTPDERRCAINKLKIKEKYEDIKALFYGEEGEESSKDAASQSKESSDDAEGQELSKNFSKSVNVKVLPSKED